MKADASLTTFGLLLFASRVDTFTYENVRDHTNMSHGAVAAALRDANEGGYLDVVGKHATTRLPVYRITANGRHWLSHLDKIFNSDAEETSRVPEPALFKHVLVSAADAKPLATPGVVNSVFGALHVPSTLHAQHDDEPETSHAHGTPSGFRYALFNDGALLLDIEGDHYVLSAKESADFFDFTDHLRGVRPR